MKKCVGRPFKAKHSGLCPICGDQFNAGEYIARLEIIRIRTIVNSNGRQGIERFKYAHAKCVVGRAKKIDEYSRIRLSMRFIDEYRS